MIYETVYVCVCTRLRGQINSIDRFQYKTCLYVDISEKIPIFLEPSYF